MPIVVICLCGKKLKSPDGSEGRRIRCPACKAIMTVPAQAAPPPVEEVLPVAVALPDDEETYELAEAPAPPPRVAPPSPLPEPKSTAMRPAATQPAPGAGSRLDSKLFQDATRRATRQDDWANAPKPLFNVLGVDVTWAKLITFSVVVLIMLSLPTWFFVWGPGAKSKLLSAQAVAVTHVLDQLETQEPYNLFSGTGNRALGMKMPKMKNPPAGAAIVDLAYCIGGPDQLYLTQPDANGTHLLVEVQLAKGLFDAHKQTSNDYKLYVNPDAFTLTPRDGSGQSIKATLLFARFDKAVTVELAQSAASDYSVLIPSGVKPTSETLDRRNGGAATGTLRFDSLDAKGQIEFVSMYHISGAPGVSGLTADGQVQRTMPGGMTIDYRYNNGTMDVEWSPQPAMNAWWTKPRYTKPLGLSSFEKLRIALLFERPPAPEAKAYTLSFVTYEIGTIKPASAAKVAAKTLARAGGAAKATATASADASKGQGIQDPLTGYLKALADARTKARGVVAMSNMNQLGIAIGMYAEQNQGRMPEHLAQLHQVMPAVTQLMTNQRTGENPGFVYERPGDRFSQIHDPARTPILWEAKNGQKDPDGSILYADGHIESRYKP